MKMDPESTAPGQERVPVSSHFTKAGAQRAAEDRQRFYDSFGEWLGTKAWVEKDTGLRRWLVVRTGP